MALKLTGAAPGQEKRRTGTPQRAQPRYNTCEHGKQQRWRKNRRIPLYAYVLFGAFIAAWVGLILLICYGVVLGILALAEQPRGIQVIAAASTAVTLLIIALAIIASEER